MRRHNQSLVRCRARPAASAHPARSRSQDPYPGGMHAGPTTAGTAPHLQSAVPPLWTRHLPPLRPGPPRPRTLLVRLLARRGPTALALHRQAGPGRGRPFQPCRPISRSEGTLRGSDTTCTAAGPTTIAHRRPSPSGGRGSGSEPEPDTPSHIGTTPIDASASTATAPQAPLSWHRAPHDRNRRHHPARDPEHPHAPRPFRVRFLP